MAKEIVSSNIERMEISTINQFQNLTFTKKTNFGKENVVLVKIEHVFAEPNRFQVTFLFIYTF